MEELEKDARIWKLRQTWRKKDRVRTEVQECVWKI